LIEQQGRNAMEEVVSATEARIHFGQMMRRVSEEQQAIIVERSGQPQIVLISIEEYERLKAASLTHNPWWDHLHQVREKVAAELAGRELPPADEIIRQMREERDAELLDLR
jgi:prevent-host-death family protein